MLLALTDADISHCVIMQDYFIKTGLHLKDAVTAHLPEEFNSLVRQSNVSEGHDMLSAPDLDAHVFVRVLEDRGAINLDPEGCAHFLFRRVQGSAQKPSRVSDGITVDPQGVCTVCFVGFRGSFSKLWPVQGRTSSSVMPAHDSARCSTLKQLFLLAVALALLVVG